MSPKCYLRKKSDIPKSKVMAKITVIIPAYNCERSIRSCIDSVRRQTESDLQILIIDDGSCDGTQKICRRLAAADPRIEYIRQQNQGVSAARNTGLSRAKAPYIMFVDSDDTVDSRICEALLTAIESRPDFDLAICGMKRRFLCEKAGKYQLKREELILPDCGDLLSKRDYGKHFGDLYEKTLLTSVCAKLYPSAILLGNRLIMKDGMQFAEDVFFNLEYQTCVSKIAVVNQPLYTYNCIAKKGSLSKQIPKGRLQTAVDAYQKAATLLREKGGREADFSPLRKVFYKDCLNDLERIPLRERAQKAKEILCCQEVRMILDSGRNHEAETALYRFCFKGKLPWRLCLMASFRRFAKRILRGAA